MGNIVKERRESTRVRDERVKCLYRSIENELGDLKHFVSRSYMYGRVRDVTKLSIRTISYIINHT